MHTLLSSAAHQKTGHVAGCIIFSPWILKSCIHGQFHDCFGCLGFGNDFHLEFEVIRAMASAWHICAEHKVEVYDENVSVNFATEF